MQFVWDPSKSLVNQQNTYVYTYGPHIYITCLYACAYMGPTCVYRFVYICIYIWGPYIYIYINISVYRNSNSNSNSNSESKSNNEDSIYIYTYFLVNTHMDIYIYIYIYGGHMYIYIYIYLYVMCIHMWGPCIHIFIYTCTMDMGPYVYTYVFYWFPNEFNSHVFNGAPTNFTGCLST